MFKIALKSLINRKKIAILVYISITLSVFLFLGVQRVSTISRDSFSRTISGTDLIIGHKTGQLNLLLYSVFHMGDAINNIEFKAFKEISSMKEVEWSIPISLGDSHKGFRVVGTNNNYFKHYLFGNKQQIEFKTGVVFSKSPFDVVIGANVAKKLKYSIGDSVVVSHGTSRNSLNDHSTLPFIITGILKPTGTPVDNNLFVPLEGITAIHIGWETGVETRKVTVEETLVKDLSPNGITAMYVGLKNRGAVFGVQRFINNLESFTLQAILPGAALFELWKIMGSVERALSIITAFVVVIGLVSLLTAQLAVLNQRRREMALLRSLGASPKHLFKLLFYESFFLTFLGCITGLILLYTVQIFLAVPLKSFGFYIEWFFPSLKELLLLLITLILGVINGLIPAIMVYKTSLTDGMTIRS